MIKQLLRNHDVIKSYFVSKGLWNEKKYPSLTDLKAIRNIKRIM